MKSGVQVLNPNPALSGGAKWNIMAAYGAELAEGRTPARAQAYLKKLFSHIVAQDSSAKNSLATFNTGKGDVLLAYQNEAIGDITSGNKLQYVVPPQSILIQNPAAVTTNSGNPKAARAFLNFLWTKKAQRDFGTSATGRCARMSSANSTSVRPGNSSLSSRWVAGRRTTRSSSIRPPASGPGSSRADSERWRHRRSYQSRDLALGGVAGRGLLRGVVTAYLSVLVLLPLAAVVGNERRRLGWILAANHPSGRGVGGQVDCRNVGRVVAINAIMGTIVAWVLVRDSFPGRRLVDTVIDLPFALPTIVAGLTLLTLYGPSSPLRIDAAYTATASSWRYSSLPCRSSFDPFNRCCWSWTEKWRRQRRHSGPASLRYSGASCCPTSSRLSWPARVWALPDPWANTARSY